jgi:hypothetical protein
MPTSYYNILTGSEVAPIQAAIQTQIVNVTAATLSVTQAAHAGRTVTINAAAGCAVTLPAATGTGNGYLFTIGTTITSNSTTFTCAGSDQYLGIVYQLKVGTGLAFYQATGNKTVITLNGGTTGGIKGDLIRLTDIASAVWLLEMFGTATSTVASPLS